MNKKNIVLVLDASQRSALAVTRSIGSLPDTRVITADSYAESLAGASKFSQLYLQCPSPQLAPLEFIQWLVNAVNRHAIDLILPMTEITSQLLQLYKNKFPDVQVPFTDYERILKMADKARLVTLAIELDIPVPKSTFYNNLSELNKSQLRYPCVLKPALSYLYNNDYWIGTTVRILTSSLDLEKAIQSDKYLSDSKFMIQEYIPGSGAGVFCFYDTGEAKAFFAHKRLREKPPSGGVSVLCKSVKVDKQLKTYATNLLDSAKWHGVAMVEFRIDLDGNPYLMEVNTRFWGSLQLAIDSGVDFPQLVYKAQLGYESNAVETYKVDQCLRWFLGDLDGLYIYLKSGRYGIKSKVFRLLTFLFTKQKKCRFEVNRLSDFRPAVLEFKLYIKELFGLVQR